MAITRHAVLLCLAAALASCAAPRPHPPGVGEALEWGQVEGWEGDAHAEAWPALLRGCRVMAARAHWGDLCRAARGLVEVDDARARRFFERWFTPHRLYGPDGRRSGLVTGYYEPLLLGSLRPDRRYRYPLYARPDSLLSVELGAVHPELAGKRVRGRVHAGKVVPFYSRREIDSDRSLLAGHELVWIDDRDAVFFLHIQGSGRIRLPDGRLIGAGYSDQNGHPYLAIGRVLVQRGELKREEVSLFSIREWLRAHPREAEEVLFRNPSYVFFTLRDEPGEGPLGALNVPLTAQRSIAIDPRLAGLGFPVWLSTNYPGEPGRPYRRLVFAQDTGGAIAGLRADLFWGHGEDAERAAGVMKENGTMLVLLPTAATATTKASGKAVADKVAQQ